MIKPRVDKLLDHADSHYAAVVVSAKRARQINSYFHNLGEGGFGEYPPPMVETNAEGNYLTMALEELAQGSKNTIVIVGAGHLVGKEGVVELLRKKGYKITQL